MAKISATKQRVLDRFEARPADWRMGDLEEALKNEMGEKRYGNYQTTKMTILEAADDGRWPKVVRHFLQENLRVFGNLPIEFHRIAHLASPASDAQERDD